MQSNQFQIIEDSLSVGVGDSSNLISVGSQQESQSQGANTSESGVSVSIVIGILLIIGIVFFVYNKRKK